MNAYALSFKTAAEIVKFIKEQDVQFIDLNFSDLRGAWHHTAQHASTFDKSLIEDGIFFDGSSIAGWQDISKSDMMLKPDLSRVSYDPFAAQKTIKVFCDVYDPITKKPYALDPRSVAKSAESYLKKSGLGDTAYFGPEPEFFIFNDVRIHDENHHIGFMLDSEEGAYNSGCEYATGNMGHRPAVKGGYFPDSPIDSLSDIRAEMLTVLESMGVTVEKHHHEVACSQCELGIKYDTLLHSADNVQLYKHVVKNVAPSYGRTATFMPKTVRGDNGSGMHVHQSIWKAGKPKFAGKSYADLSEEALYYIGGILRHARALNAFTNPTTNSYKRLVSGFEAPILLAYSARNRSAACRIPIANEAAGKRVEIRFPDPTSNPYLSFAAMLMAVLDGIENKIHPGEAMDMNLYDLSKEEARKVPRVCHSLRDSLTALEENHEFLLKGDVFSKELLESFIALKTEELTEYEMTPHPAEFKMYYSA